MYRFYEAGLLVLAVSLCVVCGQESAKVSDDAQLAKQFEQIAPLLREMFQSQLVRMGVPREVAEAMTPQVRVEDLTRDDIVELLEMAEQELNSNVYEKRARPMAVFGKRARPMAVFGKRARPMAVFGR